MRAKAALDRAKAGKTPDQVLDVARDLLLDLTEVSSHEPNAGTAIYFALIRDVLKAKLAGLAQTVRARMEAN